MVKKKFHLFRQPGFKVGIEGWCITMKIYLPIRSLQYSGKFWYFLGTCLLQNKLKQFMYIHIRMLS